VNKSCFETPFNLHNIAFHFLVKKITAYNKKPREFIQTYDILQEGNTKEILPRWEDLILCTYEILLVFLSYFRIKP